MNLLKLIIFMFRSKLFINGGGNLIQDNTSTRSLIYYLTTIWLAKKIGMKVMIYSNGIGPLNRNINKRLSSFVLNAVDQITVRESLSIDTLKTLGIIKPQVTLTADPALAMKIPVNNYVDTIFSSEGVMDTSNIVAFSVRDHDSNPSFKQTVAQAADYLIEKYKVTPVFIVMHYPSDLEVAKQIVNLMNHKGYIIHQKCDLSTMMGLLSKSKMIIGMRLHVLVFGVIIGIPIVGISYEPKVKAFMDYLNLPYSIEIENLSFDKIIKLADSVWGNQITLKREMSHKNQCFSQKALENAKIAIDLINLES